MEFAGRVAVVTGAASGIGLGLARGAAARGMRVVVADVDEAALDAAASELADAGADVEAVIVDVSHAADVERLAERAFAAFGGVHLLCNNAGVGAGSSAWTSTYADWEWVLGVNLWGVIHGLRTFVPRMLERGELGHILNTASVAGLLPYFHSAPYQVSKHGVVALSEQLYYSLRHARADVGVSVLCPAWVRTQLVEHAQVRPADLQSLDADEPPSEADRRAMAQLQRLVESGIEPSELAEAAFQAIADGTFYIRTETDFDEAIRARMQAILDRTRPPKLPYV